MKTLLYVGHYDTAENITQQRNYTLSAVNKMRYICSAINRAGWKVNIISPCVTNGQKICRGKEVSVADATTLKLFFSLATRNRIERVLRVFLTYFQLFWYLLFHTHRKEPILVYHSLTYAGIIRILKRIKGFVLVLEVEEIYADVTGKEKDRKKEFRLFRSADAFLFPTELLNNVVNGDNKPFAIVYGTYQLEHERNKIVKRNEKIVHCVYAGTLDPRKGSMNAVAAAAFLPPNYHIHILGFGTEKDKQGLLKVIEEINAKDCARVTYDGLLSGEEFIRFLQSCDIGLSTQMASAAFNTTSFPSKVLTYLSNGLQVVTVRLKALECSQISDILSYYDEDTPEAIAKAIAEINLAAGVDSRRVLENLDRIFVADMSNMLVTLGEGML